MYTPSHFRIEDLATAVTIIRANSFGILVSSCAEGMVGTHLPFLYTEPSEGRPHGTLFAHVARANPQWKSFAQAGEVLVLFQGEHGYISPTWYETLGSVPHVPTWNYEAVHVYGTPRIIADDAAAVELLHRTVDAYEPAGSAYNSQAQSAEYLANNAKAIVAFEIPITRLETKLKMSQNREVCDVLSVLTQLERAGDPASRRLAKSIRTANHARMQRS